MTVRKDSRLILWGALGESGSSLTIFEELAEEPIEKLEWEFRYPVYIEIVKKEGWKSLERLPDELSKAISAHFRQWFGDQLKEATQRSQVALGADLTAAKNKWKTLEYEAKKAMEDYATALFVQTRQDCQNCQEPIFRNVDDRWQHEEPEDEIKCKKGALARE